MAPVPEIEVVVNGDPVRLPSESTISDLLQRLGLERDRLAVEHNLEVVPRAEHVTRQLTDGDKLEVVTFVGGG